MRFLGLWFTFVMLVVIVLLLCYESTVAFVCCFALCCFGLCRLCFELLFIYVCGLFGLDCAFVCVVIVLVGFNFYLLL